MKNLRLMILVFVLMALTLGGLTLLARLRHQAADKAIPQEEDPKSPYKKAELRAMVAKLSSPIEEDRRRAEKELAKAGVFANAILDEAQKTATGWPAQAIERLKNKQRFAAMNEIDYLNALPANAAVALRAKDIKGSFEKARATPLGKIVMRPEFAETRQQVWAAMLTDSEGRARQLTLNDVNGQAAVALFSKRSALANAPKDQPEKPGDLFGAIFELNGVDPQATYSDLTARYIKAGGSIYEFEDIECVEAAAQIENGAHTRTGKNLFYGGGKNALHELIKASLGANNFGSKPEVQKLRAALGKSPDMLAIYNVPQTLDELKISNPSAEKSLRDVLSKMGAMKIGEAGAAMTVLADAFEDRFAMLLGDQPSGVLGALIAPAVDNAPIEILDKVPANALVAAVLYIDGAKLEAALGALQESVRKANPDDKTTERGFIEQLREMEKNFGLNPGELIAGLKGELGIWMTIPTGFPLVAPDVCGVLTADSAEKAQKLAEVMMLGLIKIPKVQISKMPYKNHSLYVLKPPPTNNFMLASVNFNWTVDGNRIYFSSSTRALQTQLNNLDKNAPGLLTRPNVTQALGGFSQEERRGAFIFADVPAILNKAMPFVMVSVLDNPNLSPEQKTALSQLPPPDELYKEFTPLIGFAGTKIDRLEAVIHSPLPLGGLVLTGIGVKK